ncbi:hypothetical protein QE375_002388 [Microbacterium foliorum]|uniref:DUF2961 domain-containing protein n=1 Tax=Microbacterium foliorum TaxID=104336 RepID=A0ABU1HU80_9MICO|nr:MULTISPECIES: glycoside hydrolase family 172 protein [Microbacterium]MDN3445077.1 DUF2961 domain-containing protein [Microbacterium sp. APC 3901]MDR6142834.1 hypothetical protein [Microbacterium foliorum]
MNDSFLHDAVRALDRGDRSRSFTAENRTAERGGGGTAASALGPGRKGAPCLTIPAGETVTLADAAGAGEIRHIWFTVTPHTRAVGFVLRDLVLRMYWDGSDVPSVEVPLGDFFCNGNGQRSLVASSQVLVAPTSGMNSYFRMPFRGGARITVENQHPVDVEGFFFQIDWIEIPEPAAVPELRFHAEFRRENPTRIAEDYTLIDGITGRGIYLGSYLTIVALERYWWGEGEMKFYVDGDTEYPTICGTGLEDYYGGAWAFQDRLSSEVEPRVLTYSAPYVGYPTYTTRDESQQAVYATAMAPVHGMYRWHEPDPVYFHTDLRVTVQQIGQVGPDLVERSDDVSSVAYWYQDSSGNTGHPFPTRDQRRPR